MNLNIAEYIMLVHFILTCQQRGRGKNTKQDLKFRNLFKYFLKLVKIVSFSLISILLPLIFHISETYLNFLIKFPRLLNFSKVIELILLNESCIGMPS